MNKQRVLDIAKDEDFRAVVAFTEAQLTKRVMAASTPQEERMKALAEYHGLQRLIATFGTIAHEATQEAQE